MLTAEAGGNLLSKKDKKEIEKKKAGKSGGFQSYNLSQPVFKAI